MSSHRKHPKVRLKWEARTNPEDERYAILRWVDPDTGKRRSRSLGYSTPQVAEDARGDLEAALRLQVGLPTDSFAVRVADVLVAYLQDLEGRPTSAKHAEDELWRCTTLKRHLGHLAADQVSRATMDRYQGDRRRETTQRGTPPSRYTIRHEIRTLRTAYRRALEARLITCPPPPRPSGRLPDDARPARRLSEADVAALIAAGHGGRAPDTGWLLQTLAWSGRRPVAVLALEVEDVAKLRDQNLPRAEQLVFWRRDKGGIGRGWGPVAEPAREALCARAEQVEEGRLWRISTAASLWGAVRRAAARAGLSDVQPYDLRRFAVTQILRACHGQVRIAMRFTGHRQTQTLLRYAYDHAGAAESLAARIGWTPEPLTLVERD